VSTTLATILVGLGYDLSALEKGAPEAFRLVNQHTLGMSSEMKRNAREGAEAFRSIDEMIGIHINRPMTRLLVETFPAFGKALSSVLGGLAGGAVVFAGVELFDKVTTKITEARAAQEKLAESSKTANETIGNVLGGIQKKVLELTSNDKMLRIRLEGAEEARQGIDQIAKALAAEQTAAEKANGFWTRLTVKTADFFDHVFEGWTEIIDLFGKMNGINGPSAHDAAFGTQSLANMKDTLNDMRDAFDEALNSDRFKGTHEAMTLAQRDVQIATDYLHDMQAAGDKAGITLAQNAQRFYQSSLDVQKGVATLEKAEKARAAEEELKKEVAAIQAADAATEKWAESLKKAYEAAQPPKDQYAALDAEVKKNVISLTNEWNRIGPISFHLKYDGKSLEEVEQQMVALFKITPPTINVPIPPIANAPNFVPSAAALRTLGAGGTAAGELAAFQADESAKDRLAAQAFADLLTPADKYNLTLAKLDAALKDANGNFIAGAQGQAAYAAAVQKAREEQEREERAMVRARDGLKSFIAELKEQGNAAQFTYDMLNKGLQGFEDETVKALTGAKTSWRSFFLELDQMAMKFLLNKIFSSLLSGAGNSGGGGLGGFFSSLFGGGGGAAAGGAASGGDWASVSSVLSDVGIAGFAAGTDSAPGGLAWVGEQGPELLNLPAGSSVTPMSAMRPGGITLHNHIDARGAEIGVEEKISRALSASLPQMVFRAVVESAEVQRRTAH